MAGKSEPDPDDLRVGQKIRELRLEQGLTLEGLAFEAGVDKGHLSRIERGLLSPTLRTLRSLAGRLEVPVAELLGAAGGSREP